MDNYQQVIATSRYARWLEKENRRETWDETVDRFIHYISDELNAGEDDWLHHDVSKAIRELEVMPSMRALMTAGPALERCNVAGYNCAYLPVDSLRSFDEAMYILMCGTGVGFSVERSNVNKLPTIAEHFEESDTQIIVADSKSGWARAFRELLSLLSVGQSPSWDTSRVRPSGDRLKTFGGRASGPGPLIDLFNFTVSLFRGASGRKLSSIECHDLMCKIGEIVVVGGVRRSALISLSDLDDYEMARAKSGQWWQTYPHRALANNSAVYNGKPDPGQYLREFKAIYDSKSGERGIFNRRAVVEQVKRSGRREFEGIDFGTNPCSEIILRPYQFCNLTEVVVRSGDTRASLERKIDVAVFIGTVQSRWTNFKYLRSIWKKNCEEERLLGVSLTGIYDHETLVQDGKLLDELKRYAVDRNRHYAELFGINQSVAVTCVKPSGTVSQLVDSASGLHPRHNDYYIRTIRGDIKDPITAFLVDQGIPSEVDVMNDKNMVFSFYKKSPEGAMTRQDLSALQHLDDWLCVQENWCEHKPSVTINIKEDEWPIFGGMMYEHFDKMTGIAMLPYSEHTYQQAPYQDITEEEYNAHTEADLDWSKLREYEFEDTTTGSQELACTGNACEWNGPADS